MLTLFNCSLWGDEAFSALLAQKSFWPMIQIVAKDTSPPLFYIISWIWFRIFGSSEIAIRSLSFIFYLATAYVIYLIGKTLYSKKAGVWAALLSFFNPFLFLYAFEGRMYYCLLFFTVLSFYFLIKKNKLGYILAATAALYSHHFAIFPLLSQFIWKAIQIKKISLKNIFLLVKPYSLIAFLYLPWIYPLYLQTTLVSTGFWLGKPKTKDLINIFLNFLTGEKIYFFQKYLPLAALLIVVFRRWSKKYIKSDLLLFFWAVIPPIFTFLVSQTKVSIFYERYLLYSIVPIMILLASRQRKLSFLPLGIILVIYLLASSYQFTHPFKKPFRSFSLWIRNNVPSDAYLINYNGSAHHLWETKYYGIQSPIYSPGGPLPYFVGTAQMEENDVVYTLPQKDTIGLISSDSPDKISVAGFEPDSDHKEGPLYFIWLKKKP
ncbi:MAG: glycosyltransferase family 39 protein [Candidatus Shapirobacteria bacterium]